MHKIMCLSRVKRTGGRNLVMGILMCLLTVSFVLLMREEPTASTWDETLAAAQKEGELVVVLGGVASRTYRPVFKHFEKKFSIRTVVSTGGGGRQVDRLLAERGARRFKVDVAMFGGTLGSGRLRPAGALDPIGPVLFLPEVVDQSLWYKGKHFYSDPEGKYVFSFSGGVDLTPVGMRFNTKKLSVDEAKNIKSVWEFLDKKRFAGQIVALPPTAAGATGSYSLVPFHPDLGKKYLTRFFDPELNVSFTQDFRQISDGVARGKWTMAIFVGAGGRDIDRLGRRGLPVANFGAVIDQPLKERPTLQGTGSNNSVMVLNKRPHPNAAKIFVNWLLSKEGQTAVHTMSDRAPDQSFRIDVTEMGKVLEVEMRKPGVDYMTLAHDPAVLKQQLDGLKWSREMYQKLRGK